MRPASGNEHRRVRACRSQIFCGAPLGDLHLAPGVVHVEEDEQVRCAVAPVLAVVALDLSRLGRDRLAGLADELDRALVEADHRPLRISRLGVEIEHVFHAGDVIRVDLGNAPHVLAPRLEFVLGQTPTHCLRDRLSCVVTSTSASASSSSVHRARPAGGLSRRSPPTKLPPCR